MMEGAGAVAFRAEQGEALTLRGHRAVQVHEVLIQEDKEVVQMPSIMATKLNHWLVEQGWKHVCPGGYGESKSARYITPQGDLVLIEYSEKTDEVTHVRKVTDFACPTAKEGM